MMLDQIKNTINNHKYNISGLVWSSMVYQIYKIINNSIHYIIYTSPLDHNIHYVTCAHKITQYFKFSLTCVVSLEKWSSGLVSLLLSNVLDQARPPIPLDNETEWSSDLDSIVGVR